MIQIALLADHSDFIPVLASWFRSQWPDYFAGRSQALVEDGFRREASRNKIPVRLVALYNGDLVGTVVLRSESMPGESVSGPELGGLYVLESRRRSGIGTELVRAGMHLATDLGLDALTATTNSAAGILVSLGWEFVGLVLHGDEQLNLYRVDLNSAE